MEQDIAVFMFRVGLSAMALFVSVIALYVSFRATSKAESNPVSIARKVMDTAELAHACALATEEMLKSHIARDNVLAKNEKKLGGGNGETKAMTTQDGRVIPIPAGYGKGELIR